MATTDNIKYNSTGSGLTITINSLASSVTVGRQSTVVDNSTNLYDDALVTVVIQPSGTVASTKTVSVYVFGQDGDGNYTGDDALIGASDAGYTINNPTNLKLGAVIYTPTALKSYPTMFSVAGLFGGLMPYKWGIVVCQDTNVALSPVGNSASYTGITYTNA